MRAASASWVSEDTPADLALELLLDKVHEVLPRLLGLDLAPKPLVHLVHGLQEV